MRTNIKKKTKVYNIGTPSDLTYEYEHLGNTAEVINQLLDGSHPLCEEIKKAKLPMMVVGRDALTRDDGESIIKATKSIANNLGFVNSETGWNGYNILHRSQGEINALELGIQFRPATSDPKVIFLLGCDNYIAASDIPKDSFVVYVGSHGDQGAQYADVILPAATYVERAGTYINTEGRVQIIGSIVELPGHTREQWEIFRALSEECGVALPYNNLTELRSRIETIAPHIFRHDHIERSIYGKIANKEYGESISVSGETPFVDLIDNYYMTDSVSRNSISMAKCSTAFNPVKFSNFKKIKQHY